MHAVCLAENCHLASQEQRGPGFSTQTYQSYNGAKCRYISQHRGFEVMAKGTQGGEVHVNYKGDKGVKSDQATCCSLSLVTTHGTQT